MARSGQNISNPRTGQRMRFLRTAADTGGELLSIESVNPPTGKFEPEHVHPHQESGARVVSGVLHFLVEGEGRVVGPGEAITIPAGVPHSFCNDGAEDAIAVQEFRPALRTAEFFETYFGLAERGELDEEGKPSLLRFVALGPAFADEIRLTRPPWGLQRAAFALLGPVARALGYRPA
jgi:quercetin dioxygenase-like cupin family protein